MAYAYPLLTNSSTITITFPSITGANKYHIQASLNSDFSGTLLYELSTATSPSWSFTDSGTNNKRRYYRIRHSTDSGTTWQPWQNVMSYWLNTSFTVNVTSASGTNQWIFYGPSDTADSYTWDHTPPYAIVNQNYLRIRERNRVGSLLSEFYALKSVIHADLSGTFIANQQMNEFKRWNEVNKTFWLLIVFNNGTLYVPNVWKVQFETDPDLTMIAPGRQDLFKGSVSFIEV